MTDELGNVETDGGREPWQRPSSQWDHSHALQEGTELVDTGTGAELSVVDVDDDGRVTVRVWIDERHGQEYTTESYSERGARVALRDGILETTDGLSSELATY